tara:strand:- start:5451 stop:6098 length:648 start_codon:yes stop_codon:yes gene_type:complete
MGSLILIRHGQASFGKKNYDKLSELGHLQARLLGKFFKEEGFTFDKFFSGNMSRQLETLREITQDAEPNVLKGLNEYDAEALMKSNFSGNLPEDIFKDRKSYFRGIRSTIKNWQDGGLDVKNNTWTNFKKGVLDSLHEMTQNKDYNILAISSGGPISLIVTEILNAQPKSMIDLHLQIKNSSITKIITTTNSLYLSEFNSTPHLIKDKSSLVTYS